MTQYLYGAAKSKYHPDVERRKVKDKEHQPKFKQNAYLKGKEKYDKEDAPLQFKVTPDTLVELCAIAVDKIPLPSVYKWSEDDVRKWIAKYGYPHFRNTFRVNLINGRKLLLLDACALSAMNIKNFADIRHIAYGIRSLFYFEMTKFGRSITLTPDYHHELYKLFRIKTGRTYFEVRRTDLWRRMQLFREKEPNLNHWELIERWIARDPVRKYDDIIAYTPHLRLFYCPIKMECEKVDPIAHRCRLPDGTCDCCMPPCECIWPECVKKYPWRLSCLKEQNQTMADKWQLYETKCQICIPPCECRWPPRYYNANMTLECLQKYFPAKFSTLPGEERGERASRFTSLVLQRTSL